MVMDVSTPKMSYGVTGLHNVARYLMSSYSQLFTGYICFSDYNDVKHVIDREKEVWVDSLER